ncbi:MAG: EI24 domain-containing protein [Myxococcales bacterium]
MDAEHPHPEVGRERAKARVTRKPRPGLIAGMSFPFRGARFVYLEHPGLARFWVPPILMTGVALVGVTWFAITHRGDLLDGVWTIPTGEGLMAALGRWVYRFVEWVLALVMLLVGAVVVALSTSVLAAPFNDALSEAVEGLQTGRGPMAFSAAKMLRDVGRTVGLELGKLCTYLAIMGPLFLLSLALPVVGPALYAGVGFFLTAMFFAIDHVDWPASRRDIPVGRRLRAAVEDLRPMLGLGMGVWLFMYVPLLNLLFMPAAVAGGTLMFLELHPDAPRNGGTGAEDERGEE